MSNPAQTKSLLVEVETHRRIFVHARRLYADQLAPDFNVVGFGLTGERYLSKILCWLLDPNGSHAQGPRFLALFVEMHSLKWASPYEVRINANTEHATEGGRLIDVLVDGADWAIAIENKPWAADLNEQVSDYLKHLARWRHHALFYLSGDGSRPKGTSISEIDCENAVSDGRLFVTRYTDLVPWIESCRSACRADRVRFFIDDFCRFVRKEFPGAEDMSEREDLLSLLAKPENLAAAFDVFNAEEDLRRKLGRKLVAQVADIAASRGWSVNDEGFPNAPLRIQFSPAMKFDFAFELEGNLLLFGLKEKIRNPQWRMRSILDSLPPGKCSEWYIWYEYASPKEHLKIESNWKSVEPWMQIVEGISLAERIVETAAQFREAGETRKNTP